MKSVVASIVLASIAQAQTYRGLIGIQIEDADEGSRSRAFVDLGKVFRPWSSTVQNGPAVPLDEHGWPKSDAQTVIFDIRACCPWLGHIDDPANFHPDFGGTYHLTFIGQATIETGDPSIKLRDQNFDTAKNTTTAEIDVPSSTGLFVLSFTKTKRTAGAAANTGIANMRLIRPGYARDTGDVFTHEFLDALAPFPVLRFMGFTHTNSQDSLRYPAVLNWSDRHTLDDATQQDTGRKIGFAWEYVIQLANQSGKDVWINIPVSATEDYIRQLALLFKARLNPGLRIYIEESNEVWNGLFPQAAWNASDAQAQGLTGVRRHAKRLVTIAKTFGDVFGPGSINDSIRVVFAWWNLKTDEYTDALKWIKDNYGPASTLLYGIAQTHYWNDQRSAATGDVPAILADMRRDSDDGRGATTAMVNIAKTFGLKALVYEGGADNGCFTATCITNGNRILANRDPAIGEVLRHDIADNWFPLGGDLYMYFTLSGGYSRYGTWGAVEDIANLNTPKYNALLDLVGPAPAPTADAIVNAASGIREIPEGGFFSIYGKNLANSSARWDNIFLDGVTLPTALNGVRVRVNGRDAYVAYAGSGQINALAPTGVAGTDAAIEIVTPNGRVTTTAAVAPVSPAFFPCPRGGAAYACAILPFEPGVTFVAPAGVYDPPYLSRPAKPGEVVELFATGLGGLGADFPLGKALAAPYEIDNSKISVTVGGVAAEVLYAGAIFPGEYQVNIRLGKVTTAGDLPVVVSTGGKSSPAEIRLAVAGDH